LLEKKGGALNVTDKSDAGTIYDLFGVSKKTFKKALGALYKKRLIVLDPDKIRLVK
jgi:predicted RNA-binding protein (virulence factor B family)